MRSKIFQVFYDQKTLAEVEACAIAFDNSNPERINEYEYGVMRKLYSESMFTDSDLYGVFSWKFRSKTGMSVQDLLGLVANQNEGFDVITVNPYPHATRFHNVWDQGEYFHPGMSCVAKELFEASRLDTSLLDARMDARSLCYCNYWLGSRRFLDLYFSFTERIYSVVYQDSRFTKEMILGVRDRCIQAPLFPFIFERLFSTLLAAYRPSFRVLNVTLTSSAS